MLTVSSALTALDNLYPAAWASGWVAEAGEPFVQDIPEKLVSCLWFDPRWRPDRFATLEGRVFTVHSPGQWNRQAGPDFRQAVIDYTDGERCQGDVEIHRDASGWMAHRHHLDERYNRVILHVILRHDRSAVRVVRADGQSIPQVLLTDWLPHPLSVYRTEISLDDYPHKHAPRIGHCYTVLQTLALPDVQRFLERAGESRLQRRMGRWAGRAREVGVPQTLYEAMFRSLGAAGYRQYFQAFARHVSWRDAQQCLAGVPMHSRRVAAEALLLGMAGMLTPAVAAAAEFDAQTQAYLAVLQAHWKAFPAEMTRRAWEQVSWRFPHVRPANTPERRLAGMAQLLARYHNADLAQVGQAVCRDGRGLTEAGMARSIRKGLLEMCGTPEVSYWSGRARFGARPIKAQRLIGGQRALTLVIDAILPLLLLEAGQQGDARSQDALLACFRLAPRLPDNAIIRDMERRLLGENPALLALVTRACHQQGLLQVFEDYCSHDDGDCQGCHFPLSHASGAQPA